MSDHYFFVTSTESLYDRVLPLIEEKSKMGPVHIYAGNEEIKKFFTTYTKHYATVLPFNVSLISKRTWYKLILELINLHAWKYAMKRVNKSHLYFFTSSCYISLYSLIQDMAKNNSVYFFTIPFHHTGTPQTDTASKLKSKLIKLLLGIDTFMAKTGGNSYPRLSPNFFKDNRITTWMQEFNTKEDIAKEIRDKITELKNKEILFIEEPQDITGNDRIDYAELHSSSDILYDMLDSRDNITITKPHQKKFMGYGKMTLFDTLPNFVPSEFILGHPWKIIIGIESFSLVMATRLSDSKVISLINMFYYNNEKVQNNLQQTLEQESKGKILFPETIEQLQEMLQ